MATQIWKLEVEMETHTLICYRLDEDGKRKGKETRWEIQRRSNLPRGLFHHIEGFVQRRVNEAKKEGSDEFRKPVFRGLCEAGKTCGCEIKVGTPSADVVWLLGRRRFIAFQLHEVELSKGRASRLNRSKAVYRLAVVIRANGYPYLEILETNPKYRA
jgi:hypothetical protein